MPDLLARMHEVSQVASMGGRYRAYVVLGPEAYLEYVRLCVGSEVMVPGPVMFMGVVVHLAPRAQDPWDVVAYPDLEDDDV